MESGAQDNQQCTQDCFLKILLKSLSEFNLYTHITNTQNMENVIIVPD